MNRHMFISTHNHWFSRLTLLSSLIVLCWALLGIYTEVLPANNLIHTWTELLQTYLTNSVSILSLFLTAAAWYLHRELGYKPFTICLGLLLLAISQYFAISLTLYLHLAISMAFTQTLIKLSMVSLLWWLCIITGPRDNTIVHANDKKYILWTWLGFVLLFLQILLSIWLTTSHMDLVCTDFPYCNGQLLPALDFHALITSPLNHAGLITLQILYRICTIVTTLYLTIFSMFFMYTRTLREMGILLFLFMLTQTMLGIIGWILQTSLWISFGHNIISMFVLLAIISLLIELYRKYMTSYR